MNTKLREKLNSLSLDTGDILLPKEGIDYGKWAVVACDQFTSQRDYWKKVEEITKDVPSTIHLIYPECYLEDGNKEKIIDEINSSMKSYLEKDIFTCYKDSFILVERSTSAGVRHGLVASLDLESYSYEKDSRSLIRATEGTILSRIPPRKEIRKNALLELPHIMVLISDSRKSIIERLAAKKDSLPCVYDTELMLGGGHIRGYLVNSDEDIGIVADGLQFLYDRLDKSNPLLYAMGDGNHSLATAKSLYEDLKQSIGPEKAKQHPSRWALVEIENIFDPALTFEAIHRVFFNTDEDTVAQKIRSYCSSVETEAVPSLAVLRQRINVNDGKIHFGLISGSRRTAWTVTSDRYSLGASIIQACIDSLLEEGRTNVDYIHGAEVTERIASEEGNTGIIMSEISKETFFDDIIKDGAFPRKTFSIGHAEEKRYYMEGRRIR